MFDLHGPAEPDDLEEDTGAPDGGWRPPPGGWRRVPPGGWRRDGDRRRQVQFDPDRDADQTMESVEPGEQREQEPESSEEEYDSMSEEEGQQEPVYERVGKRRAESPIAGPSGLPRQQRPRQESYSSADFPVPTAPSMSSSQSSMPNDGNGDGQRVEADPQPTGSAGPRGPPSRRAPPLPTRPASKRKAALQLQESIRTADTRKSARRQAVKRAPAAQEEEARGAAVSGKQARHQGVKRAPAKLAEQQRGKTRRSDESSDDYPALGRDFDANMSDYAQRTEDTEPVSTTPRAPAQSTAPTAPTVAPAGTTPPTAVQPARAEGRAARRGETGQPTIQRRRSYSPPARSRSPPVRRGEGRDGGEGRLDRLRRFGERVLRGAQSEDEGPLSCLMMVTIGDGDRVSFREPTVRECLASVFPIEMESDEEWQTPDEE